MNELEKAREQINIADKEIAKYFEMRMVASQAVAKYKKENFLPIVDLAREKLVIEKNQMYIENEDLRPFYVLFQQYVMDVSKMYQRQLLEGMKVAYSGVEGAYAHIAARKIFPHGQHIPYPNFEKAYEAVITGECDCVVLPIENSVAGEVGSNMDMIYSGSLFINGMYELQISHNLLAKKGAALSDIKTAISHSQALDQCAGYINRSGLITRSVVNTAVAAKMVAEGDDMTVAAIASKETARLYGLEIIAETINESSTNTTRFAVLSRSKPELTSGRIYPMAFEVKHEAGSLAKVIQIIGKYGFNMHIIKSRALKDVLWQYYFYIEIEGDLASEEGQQMLTELKGVCINVKVLGAYDQRRKLED